MDLIARPANPRLTRKKFCSIRTLEPSFPQALMSCCGKHSQPKTPMPQKQQQETGPFGVFASKQVRDARMKTCNSCPEFKPKILHVMSICRICSCVLEGKTWLENQECPLGKWAK